MSDRLHLDSLVRGKAGSTDRLVQGRVYHMSKSGSVGILDVDGKQWIVYEPEIIEAPRPVRLRTDIPSRLGG